MRLHPLRCLILICRLRLLIYVLICWLPHAFTFHARLHPFVLPRGSLPTLVCRLDLPHVRYVLRLVGYVATLVVCRTFVAGCVPFAFTVDSVYVYTALPVYRYTAFSHVLDYGCLPRIYCCVPAWLLRLITGCSLLLRCDYLPAVLLPLRYAFTVWLFTCRFIYGLPDYPVCVPHCGCCRLDYCGLVGYVLRLR